jgi:hypothetical protein
MYQSKRGCFVAAYNSGRRNSFFFCCKKGSDVGFFPEFAA